MKLKDLLGDDYNPEMSVKDIEKHLAKLDLVDKAELEGKVDKTTLDKALSDLAQKKKELKDAKKESTESVDELTKLRQEFDELKKEKTISEQTAKFVSLGFSEDEAKETATAMIDGNFEKVTENISKFSASVEKKIKADEMENTQRPKSGEQTEHKRLDTSEMSLAEMQKLYKEDPEAFKE